MAVLLLHDAVFEPLTKVYTVAQTKLNGILRNSEVSQILRGAMDDDDEKWLVQPWKIPALQIWSALESKFNSFSNEQKDGSNKRKKPARKNEKECTYCKKAGKWFQGHEESDCHHKKKDEAEAALQAIKERRDRQGTPSDSERDESLCG
jgi:hypothetical protein